ncbi:MAG: type II secretion system F family protein [Burkholderiaceae bacterium]|nr:type II secretion system F family protein [Burkholderiaceae bacterium]MCX8003764.1 type II secretion system F family protein [Burkholderiaceae bacterium]
MIHYQYRAVAADGRVFQGAMSALNEADLQARLQKLNLHPVRVRQVAHDRLLRWRARGIGLRDRIDFYSQLLTLLKAGVPVVEALADIGASAAPGSPLAHATGALVHRIESGAPLSEALGEQRALCDEQTLGLLRAGEASGNLTVVLERIVQMLKWRDELATKVRKAVSYPAFVAVVVSGAVTFLMVFLVPQLVQFLQMMGQQLPWQTRLLIATSDAFVRYGYLIFGLPIAVVLAAQAAVRRTPALRLRWHAAVLKLPVAGPIVQKIELARFASTLSLMYQAGVPLLEGMRQAEAALANLWLRQTVAHARAMIGSGAGIGEAFAAIAVFPPLLVRMLRVGERSGDLDGALTHVTYFFNRDVDESVARMQAKIEPTLTLILGLLLAWVLSAVLGPVYDAVGRVNK